VLGPSDTTSDEIEKGKDAMASRYAEPRLAQLWQLPLLLMSLALFTYAGWLLIDPQPGPTFDDRMASIRQLLKQERPSLAIEQLNRLLLMDKLTAPQRGQIHLSLAEAIHLGQQKQRHNIVANHLQVIEQTRLAQGFGVTLDASAHRRVAESNEALGRFDKALDHYRQAMSLDPQRLLSLRRKVIELMIDSSDPAGADHELQQYLADARLGAAERSWALGERAQLLSDQGKFTEARLLLDEAIRIVQDPTTRADTAAYGQVNYRLGYVAWKLGDLPDAERYLRAARDLLGVKHPLDADAAYTLGRLMQDQSRHPDAISFFDAVLLSHPTSRVSTPARLARGLSRLQSDEEEPGMADLHDATAEVSRRASRSRHRDEVISGLQQAQRILMARERYAGTLELLAYEQRLQPEPPASFFARLGVAFERRADQLERGIAEAPPSQRVKLQQQARDARLRAADGYVAHAQKLVLSDDKAYGESLWRGIDLYDRAGDLPRVIASLEMFLAERPDDPLAPDALLRLGRSYQAAGQFDKAIAAYQRNQFRYPQSLAASKSGVPLAQAYVAKGPEFFGKAEQVLLGVVDNNPLLTPEADEFRQAVFELAMLYYRTGRFEESVARFEEFVERYPEDTRLGQLLFFIADSYRKSAALLDGRLASATASTADSPTMDLNEATAARADRLKRARALFDRTIAHYRDKPPTADPDQMYFRLAHFYRADCLYDLGEFEQAIALYDTAAFKFQNDPSALAAYVQIVNAYCALGKVEEAKTANERAKWLLRRIPPEAFTDGSFTMPRQYWEQWLKWSGEAGLW
jgi:tetratricopeptide (TPR) repeat protein